MEPEKGSIEPVQAQRFVRGGAHGFQHKVSQLESLVREQPQEESEMIMKKASRVRRSRREGMRREYEFDYRKSRPNRFASLMKGGAVAVVLDPEVAAIFPNSAAVNKALHSLVEVAESVSSLTSGPNRPTRHRRSRG